MAATKLIGFKKEYLELADVREYEKDLLSNPDSLEMLEARANMGDSYTLMHDGRVLAFAGLFFIHEGVAEVWIIPTGYMYKFPRVFARNMRDLFQQYIDTGRIHRFQTLCQDDAMISRWMEWLGFECEGVLRQYSQDKKDYRQYARVIKG